MENFEKGRTAGIPVKHATIDLTKTIKQSNNLVEANYYLSEREQRFILLFISQLDKNAPDFCQIELPISQIADALHLGKDRHKILWDIADHVMEKVLTIRDSSGGWYKTHWVQSVCYNNNKQSISLCFDKKLKPDLLQLKEAYVMADTSLCLSFRGKYTARLYMLIKQYLRVGERLLTIDRLIEQFNFPKSYKARVSNIQNNFIIPTTKQILEQSDITFKYEYARDRRKIIGVRFYDITLKEKTNIAPPVSKYPLKKELKLNSHEERVFDRMTCSKWGITPDVALKTLAKYGLKRCEENLNYAHKYRKGKYNLSGWALSCIVKDYANLVAIKQEEIEHELIKMREKTASVNRPIIGTDLYNVEVGDENKDNIPGEEKEDAIKPLSSFEIQFLQRNIERRLTPYFQERLKALNITIDDVMKMSID